jgi:hypothetical protein
MGIHPRYSKPLVGKLYCANVHAKLPSPASTRELDRKCSKLHSLENGLALSSFIAFPRLIRTQCSQSVVASLNCLLNFICFGDMPLQGVCSADQASTASFTPRGVAGNRGNVISTHPWGQSKYRRATSGPAFSNGFISMNNPSQYCTCPFTANFPGFQIRGSIFTLAMNISKMSSHCLFVYKRFGHSFFFDCFDLAAVNSIV